MREERFVIVPGSEIMAILALATDLADLETRLGRIIVGLTRDRKPVTAADLKASGAMTLLLKDAILPNLVQTLEGGPGAGARRPVRQHRPRLQLASWPPGSGLSLGDIVLTEAGFGADLGAEKFFDIKCRFGGLKPEAAVVVATVRALKMHGGVKKDALGKDDVRRAQARHGQPRGARAGTCRSSACRWSSRSTASPPIPRRSSTRCSTPPRPGARGPR